MTQEMQAIANALSAKLQNGKNVARNVPFAKGDKLTFKLSESILVNHPASGNINAWDGVKTEGDTEISVSQLVRKNNGLPLKGNTVSERFVSFCEFLAEAEDGTRTITVSEIRTRELIQTDGTHTLQRTMLFTVD